MQRAINLITGTILLVLILALMWPFNVWSEPTVHVVSTSVTRGDELEFHVHLEGWAANIEIERGYACNGFISIDFKAPENVNDTIVVPPRVPKGSECNLEIRAERYIGFRTVRSTVVSPETFVAE